MSSCRLGCSNSYFVSLPSHNEAGVCPGQGDELRPCGSKLCSLIRVKELWDSRVFCQLWSSAPCTALLWEADGIRAKGQDGEQPQGDDHILMQHIGSLQNTVELERSQGNVITIIRTLKNLQSRRDRIPT